MKLIPTTAQAFREKYPDDYVDSPNIQYYDTDIDMGVMKDITLGQIAVTSIPKGKEKDFDEAILLMALSGTFAESMTRQPNFEDIGGFDGDDRDIYAPPFDYREERIKRRKNLNKLRIIEIFWKVITTLVLLPIEIFILYIIYNILRNGG